MQAIFDPGLIALSVLIALIAVYAALHLASALTAAHGRVRWAWLGAGGLAMGVGLWSLHFVGMLAFGIPGRQIAYNVPLLVLAVAVAVLASSVALWAVSRPAATRLTAAAAGLFLGAATAGMHYICVLAMRVPAGIRWYVPLVATSVGVAVLASSGLLWWAYRVRTDAEGGGVRHRVVGALVFGLASAGVHYTAMAAMRLAPGAGLAPGHADIIATDGLAIAVALGTLIILAIAIAGSAIDRALARRMDLALENERLFRDAERDRSEAEAARAEAERAREEAERARTDAERAHAESDRARRHAERRAAEEQVLRRATRELGLTEDVRGLAQALVHNALALVPADGAWLEARERHGARDSVRVVAVHGKEVPADGHRVPYPGSLTEEILAAGAPGVLPAGGPDDASLAPYLTDACRGCTLLAVPLIAGGVVQGALVLVRPAGGAPFEERESGILAPLADTAAAALRRVGLTEALRESEQRLRQLAENIREVFWVLDLDTRCMVYVSPGYEQVWGRSAKELHRDALAFTRGVHPDDRPAVDAAMTTLARGEYDVEYRIIRPDGEQRWIHARGSPVRDERGRIFRIAGIAEDITARKEVEQAQQFLIQAGAALASSLDYHETLRLTARQAVPHVADWCAIDVREDEEIRRVAVAHPDPAREALAQLLAERYPADPDEPTGVPHVLRTGQPELIRHVDDNLLQVIARDTEHLGMLRELGLRSMMTVPMSARGRTLGAITFVVAESGRHYEPNDLALARELAARAALAVDNALLFRAAEQRRVELERATESRARLMRGFSHDLKNPLGAADGYAQLLEDGMYGELNPQQKQSVGRMRNALAAALRLITDLLELARAESGLVEVRPQPTDIGRTIAETVADYQAQAAAANLSMDVEPCDGLPLILTDANRARQVLGNLLSNAVKYTPPGGGVKVRICEDQNGGAPGPGSWVRIDVQDDGPGIPPEKQEVVFEEFQRLDTRGAKGAGMGLAISRRIARALRGEITLESEPGAGSRFTFWLPCILNR
jgi:PAS domain S-box-containing protein